MAKHIVIGMVGGAALLLFACSSPDNGIRIGAACDDGDACTADDVYGESYICQGQPKLCETPPDAACKNDQELVAYRPTGNCQSGFCLYPEEIIQCAQGCQDGQCQDCLSAWEDVAACDCEPSACLPCAGQALQADGCGNFREADCSLPATGCAGLCCAGSCCVAGQVCDQDICCSPDCAGRECGSDGCGGDCGPCGQDETCDPQGQCQADGGPADLTLDPTVISMSSYDGAYPRVARLADGTLLAGFDSAITDGRAIRVSRSSDNGSSWADISTVAQHTGDIDLANAFPLQLASGRVLMAFRHHDLFESPIIYRLEVCYSDDNGGSWKFLSAIEVNSGTPIWEPFLLAAPDGSLQAYYARERENNEQDNVMRRSWDGGETWGPLVTVSTALGSRDGMPAVSQLENGHLLAVFEAFRDGEWGMFVIKSVLSTDQGSSWGNRSLVYAPADGSRKAGAPYIVTLGNGQLLASFMTDEDSATVDWPHYAAMKVVASADAPASGSGGWLAPAATIVEPAAYWPGLFALPNDDILCLYSQGGVKLKIGHADYP